ncbi:MAG: hypothetical protein KAS32_08615 [Candidatus Peribacteraceae bacterium]|nr:hypothetical protein [Candidatus Peribacteraceae bacterium]
MMENKSEADQLFIDEASLYTGPTDMYRYMNAYAKQTGMKDERKEAYFRRNFRKLIKFYDEIEWKN